MGTALRINLLGGLHMEDDAGPIVLPAGRAARTCRLLLAAGGRIVSADVLAEALWPDQAPLAADRVIRPLISRLRRRLGAERIVTDGPGWRFALDACWIDLHDVTRLEVEAAVLLGARAPALALTAAEAGLALLARGEPLVEDAYADWAQPLRREAARQRRSLRRSGWSAATALGEHERAHDLAARAVDDDPFDEGAWRAMLAALAGSGRPATALGRYQDLRRFLADELGTAPSAETQALRARLVTVVDDRPYDPRPEATRREAG